MSGVFVPLTHALDFPAVKFHMWILIRLLFDFFYLDPTYKKVSDPTLKI
jgi:hypothetical protein